MHLSHHEIFSDSWQFIGICRLGGGLSKKGMIAHFEEQGIGVYDRVDHLALYRVK